jgi:hypothetical protein
MTTQKKETTEQKLIGETAETPAEKTTKQPTLTEKLEVEIDTINFDNADLKPDDVELPRSSILTSAQQNNIIAKLNEKWQTDSQTSLIAIAILLQQGGTAKSCDGNLTVKFKNKEYKLAQLRAALKSESLARSERKLARSLATKIEQICKKLQIPGNLAKRIKQNFPQERILEDEIYWLSDFQSDNPDCPENIRQLLSKNFLLGRQSQKKKVTEPTQQNTK